MNHRRDKAGIDWASPDWHQVQAESVRPHQYGQEGCDLCQGLGHIVEIRRVVGPRIEVEIRPFDVDTEQRPDEGEVWICPNCFWATQGTTDPLRSEPHWTTGLPGAFDK